mmetsp:Transcript_60246/g.107392  ORF Transcript_60246/g.107392 Transcript_60246/m.107392 type:complete len:539 (-) Transcript_60246:138-1754(-)
MLNPAPAMAVESSRRARIVAEFIGAFLLCFAVGCNTLANKYVWGWTSNGCVLMLLTYMFNDVSGAHFNPAISTAAFLLRKLSLPELAAYCASQIFGALCGAACYSVMFWEKTFDVGPKDGFNWFQAGLCELLYTGMLVFVFLNCDKISRSKELASALQGMAPPTAATPPSQGIEFGGLAIGFVLVAGGYSAGPVSGGVFNPALAFAIDIFSSKQKFGWSMAYSGYQLMGCALACVFFTLMRPLEFGKDHKILKIEKKLKQEIRLSMLLAEFLGTFAITVTLGLNVLARSRATAWSVGAALMCMIYAVGDISGGQFNPAVTLAVVGSSRYERGITSPVRGAMYLAVQFAAGIMGSWTFASIYAWESFSLGPYVESYNWATRVPVEIFFTFVLCFAVLSVATTSVPKDQFSGLVIGTCLVIGGYVVSMVSGGTMNPAVTFGVATTGILCSNCTSFLSGIGYIALEFMAAVVAVIVFYDINWFREYVEFGFQEKPMTWRMERTQRFTIPSGAAPTTASGGRSGTRGPAGLEAAGEETDSDG